MRGNYEGSDVAGVRSGLVASERDARIDGDGVNAQAIQLINARMPDGDGKTASEASVQQLAQANAAEHAAMGQQIDQIGVSLGDKADSSVVAQLRSEVDTIDGQVRANSQSLTSLTDRVVFAEGGVAANSSAISGLASTVSQHGDTISAHTQQLTQIGGKVTDLEGKELANSSAISGLTTQVSQQGGRLDSQADQITRLSSHIDGVDGKANANASAISGLNTRVAANEQGLTSQAQQTTRLEAKIVASSPNLLRNPKFTDNWTGWTISPGVNIGNNTWDGTYAFCAGNPNDYRYLIQAVAYSGGANRPVTASVDMYRNSLRGTMFVRVAFYDAADNVLAYSPTANINHPVGEWKRYESTGTVPAATVQLRIELFTFDTDTNNSFRRAKLEMGATASPFDEGKSVDALASGFSNLNVQVQQQGQSIAANATQINGVQVALGNKAEASVVVEMDARMKDTMTGGGNLLENSRLLDGTQGWDQRWNPGGWTLSASPAGTNWDPQGVLSFGGSRYAAGNGDAYGVWGNKRRIPVVPGKRYFVSSYTRYVTRDFQAKSPVVAVTGPNTNFGLSVVLTSLGGNNWRVSAYTGASTVFGTVWVYDSVVTGTPGKTGIEVYREHTGELAFASWAKPLRIVGVATAPFGAAEGAYVQVPSGRRYGVISSRSCQRIERNVGFRLTGPQGNGTGSGSAGRFYYAGAAALIPQADNATQFSASGHFILLM